MTNKGHSESLMVQRLAQQPHRRSPVLCFLVAVSIPHVCSCQEFMHGEAGFQSALLYHDDGTSHSVESSFKALPEFYQANYRPRQLSDNPLLPFTEEVQADIWQHQNPSSCEGQSFVRQTNHASGLGSMLHVATAGLGYAFNQGSILLYGDDFGKHFGSGRLCDAAGAHNSQCFFMPASNCSAVVDAAAAPAVPQNAWDYRTQVPQKWRDRWEATNQTGDIVYWWRAQAVTYLFRFNARTADALSARRLQIARQGVAPLPLPLNTVSVHVRHGDKVVEMTTFSWEEHLARAQDVAEARRLAERYMYVTTDDSAVALQAEVGLPSSVDGYQVLCCRLLFCSLLIDLYSWVHHRTRRSESTW
eukprot:TRINITY_DN1246_c0_g1_i3.p1 TRINITY_DN1246_c0_g1~~TRINITY_DN1246_c0_g1_i3.p1  ORF type:complete len:360 (+),score=51.29 TRINITY_DN1246_c0_g1_i3:1406-2485(+)